MGRWWTGYTSISAGRLSIAHSHGEPWLFAATERLQPAYGYGLWKAKRPSEKMGSIAVCGGAGCELGASHHEERGSDGAVTPPMCNHRLVYIAAGGGSSITPRG